MVKPIGGSFRDPNGFVFKTDDVVHRQVNQSYKSNYDRLMESGLYDELIRRRLLIAHTEVCQEAQDNSQSYKILRPEQIPFVSYPYEWSFSQLKDAALVTLAAQERSLAHDMTLKDASAFNIQFNDGKPVLIDTLSFEEYQEGQAWVAYKQFCQHFLAPLLLMSHKDIRLSQLTRIYIDGIPLDLAAALLPKRTYLRLGIAMHVHLHVRAQKRYAGVASPTAHASKQRLNKNSLMNILNSLQSTIDGLKWDHGHTSWSSYNDGDSYQEEGFYHKQELVKDLLSTINPSCVWDLGANTGVYSRIASQQGIFTVSMDSDPGVVEANYLRSKQQKEQNLHPLLIDLTNPSAAIGWSNSERDSLAERSRADCLLALALIHHIAISNNVPLIKIANYFASLAEWLIVEFVPKNDDKVRQLLSSREDIFAKYSQSGFEQQFGELYEIIRSHRVQSSERILYLLRRKRSIAI